MPEVKLDPITFGGLRPGDIVMHHKQFNRLCGLMKTRMFSVPSMRETTWNGVRVHIDDHMPESGWFIVPGTDG